ncbi:21553_t:CDS:10, partial [Entrophospora sp. SA101]
MLNALNITSACDFHIHLRQDALMKLVVPLVAEGGVSLCYVMPNLKPPITSTEQALTYKGKLQELAPNITFLMSVKSYPRGVTTNSDSGIESYTNYYQVFKAMEEEGMILNLHGELPSDPDQDVCVLNAEEKFLVHLQKLHQDFPNLKIVLEHATTKAAVDVVKSLGDTVGCTITIHHLQLVADDWAGKCHNFCKPVAKYPHDRQALRDVILEGHPRFFLGTDSAPHPAHLKECAQSCAGVFTTPLALAYLATILDSFGAIPRLNDFACENGKKFYECRRFSILKLAEKTENLHLANENKQNQQTKDLSKENHFNEDFGFHESNINDTKNDECLKSEPGERKLSIDDSYNQKMLKSFTSGPDNPIQMDYEPIERKLCELPEILKNRPLTPIIVNVNIDEIKAFSANFDIGLLMWIIIKDDTASQDVIISENILESLFEMDAQEFRRIIAEGETSRI